ncbi:MAG: sugar phosphate isomerase/epimerase [Clostridiales bacterium]|nr:sugar phosphate isomerase/epimerase [Clostridiales bacterium]
MKKLGINFENVLAIKEELNINVLQALYKLKGIGITSLDVKYERLIGENSYLKEILISGLSVDSLFAFCPLGEQNNYKKALEIVDFAVEYKVKEIMLLPEFIEGGYDETMLSNLKQNLRRIVKYAEAFGVSIGIENVGVKDYPFNDESSTLDVLKSVKGLHLIFDGGNFLLYGVNPFTAVNSLAPYVQRYHLKDRTLTTSLGDFIETTADNKNSTVVEVGKGDCSCLKVYENIRQYYPSVPLVLEFPFGESNIFDKVEKSAMYVHTEMFL